MEIKNRNVENPNRRILNVIKTNKDEYGDIISLEVEMYKDEGQVYEEGFALNAENLKALVQGFKISSEEDSWFDENNTTEINITSFRKCYVMIETEYNQYVNYTINKLDDTNYYIYINPVSNFEELTENIGNFQIELVIAIYDQISQFKIGEVPYVITYTKNSETIID